MSRLLYLLGLATALASCMTPSHNRFLPPLLGKPGYLSLLKIDAAAAKKTITNFCSDQRDGHIRERA